ncbi:MAG TPA: hypothetical protein VI172_13865 [Candidatus Dormibacteraeota bacterium]
MPNLERWVGASLLVLLIGACGPFCGNGRLNLANATLNPKEFTCPINSTNYGYDIKGTLDADNQSSNKITVKSMSTTATVQKLQGSWAIAVGDKSGAENIEFSPRSIDPGQKTTFKLTTPWSCSNSGTNGQETYADFKIQLVIETDHGKYAVDLPAHRMRMA